MANRLLFTVPNPWPVIRLAGRISLSASYECQGVTGERTGPRENGVRATFAASFDRMKKKERGEGTKLFQMESRWIAAYLNTSERVREI